MSARVVEGVARSAKERPATIAALGSLYEQRYRKFLRVAEAIVGDVELARDVVQEGFARAVRRRSDYRGEGSLEGWVWRTLVNVARNTYRDQVPAQLPLDQLAEGPSLSNGYTADGELRVLIAALPERQRLVLFLRYFADLDYRQIAEALEIRTGTVGATLNQAHAAIRRRLEEVTR